MYGYIYVSNTPKCKNEKQMYHETHLIWVQENK